MTALLALLLLGTLGSRIPSDADIAARIETLIRTQFHPASVTVTVHRNSPFSTTLQQVDIRVSGFTANSLPFTGPPGGTVLPPADDKQIQVVRAQVVCEDFTAGGLPIRRMAWEVTDARIPLAAVHGGGFTITAARSALGAFTLDEEGLTRFLRTRSLPLTFPSVRLDPAGCRVSGTTRAMVAVPVAVGGRLTTRGNAVLWLQDPKLHVSIVPVPGVVTSRLLRDINPLTDLNRDLKLPIPLRITHILHGEGTLRIDAALEFPPPE